MKTPKANMMLMLSISLISCGQSENEKDKNLKQKLPNIIYILTDDLGYGDVTAYNPQAKTSTPNIDRLAAQGMLFTDAHSTSSVCTPSRYSILTGRYCWRSRLSNGVLNGYGKALIGRDRPTVASLLKERGYSTAVIGKWHLGLDWTEINNRNTGITTSVKQQNILDFTLNMNPGIIDFSVPPANGPTRLGFDYSFILPASLDMEPYCYLSNDTLITPLTEYTPGNELNSGYTGAFWRACLMAAGFDFNQVLPNITNEATDYIRKQSCKKKPFFLYFPMTAPHTPWLPSEQFSGKTGAGLYGAFVSMVDEMTGKILKVIEECGLEQNTIVIFTSDNGPYWHIDMIEKYGHKAAGPFRGMKADVWEGGHRVPFIVRWPKHVSPGSKCNATTTLANLMATVADITGISQEKVTGEDTYSILPVLMGKASVVEDQKAVVHHSSLGLYAIRKGDWKLILGKGSGGFSIPFDEKSIASCIPGQLYNLQQDSAEATNLYMVEKDRVAELQKLLDSIQKLPSKIKRTKCL
jgi:arylsulfatase A